MSLTKKDLEQVGKLLDSTLESKFNKNNEMIFEFIIENNQILESAMNTKIDDVKADLKHLPTKEEFYESQDKLMKEIKDLRDEVTVSGHQVVRNTKRIEQVEKEVFGKIT